MRFRDEVSESLLAAAVIELNATGPDGLSVRRVSQQAGLSTMNVYSRYGNLSALIDEVVVDGFEQFTRTLTSIVPTGDTVYDLVTFAEAYRAWALAQPARYRLMMSLSGGGYKVGPTALEARLGLIDAVTQRVVAARAARSTPPAPMTAEDAATVVVSMLHGMTLLELDGVILEVDSSADWTKRFAAVVQFGFRVPPDQAA